jgi:organic hydroperoxide reductase OsmC/OhrA
MIKYPISFSSRAQTASGIQRNWVVSSGDHALICAIPPEFEGPGGGLSPEDLYAQALTNCFIATFKVYAEKSNLDFLDLNVNSELFVDLNEQRKPVMKRMTIKVEIAGTEQEEKARSLAEKAFKSGFILNSVKTDLTLDLTVNGKTTL